MSLKKLIDEELPLNRKERFFTGTVLPMIVCKDNFKYLHGLLKLVGCEENLNISAEPGQENILFFSEYSFVESVIGQDESRFQGLPKKKNTPDIIILIRDERVKILVAIEAKMYDIPNAQKLKSQMDEQHNILDYLQKKLHIENDKVYHVALLPSGLYENIDKDYLQFKMITWEDVYSIYKELLGDDYFLEILRLALSRYPDLVSKGVQYRKYCENLYQGRFIYENYKNETLDKRIMGRELGLHGDKLANDIKNGGWENQYYETSSATEPFNRNWFYIKDFIKLVDKQ